MEDEDDGEGKGEFKSWSGATVSSRFGTEARIEALWLLVGKSRLLLTLWINSIVRFRECISILSAQSVCNLLVCNHIYFLSSVFVQIYGRNIYIYIYIIIHFTF